MQQARPGAAREHSIGAAAQQEHLLQGGQGRIHRMGRGERAEVLVAFGPRPAMFHDPREVVPGFDHDVGKRLIVLEDDVVARVQLLDQVAFQQQRLGLGMGHHHFERVGLEHHALQAQRHAIHARIGCDALFQVFGLADVKGLALGVQHSIDARLLRQVLDGLDEHGKAVSQRFGRRVFPGRGGALGRYELIGKVGNVHGPTCVFCPRGSTNQDHVIAG